MSLEITMGGRMIRGEDAVAFFEAVAELIPEEDRTEEFCDEYEYALNRLRRLVLQNIPVPQRKLECTRFTEYLCGKCGFGLREFYNFCPKCGRRIGKG